MAALKSRPLLCSLIVSAAPIAAAEGILHKGSVLGPNPEVTRSMLFNTPDADAMQSVL